MENKHTAWKLLRIAIPTTLALLVSAIGCANSSAEDPSPKIEFVYPHPNDVISNYPIYIETKVSNCSLEQPVQYWSAVDKADTHIGHIHYTLDNAPIFATKSTQVVIETPSGKELPTGKHVIRAEIVYINHEHRNPPIFAEITVNCERPQQNAGSQSAKASVLMDARTRSELQLLEKQVTELQQQISQLKSQTRDVPNP